MSNDPLEVLGQKVRDARIEQRFSVKAAAEAANIARDTWKRIEEGKGVQDTSRRAALDLLGLDWWGERVGGPSKDEGYVASPGEKVQAGDTDDEVLRAIREMREEQRRMSERLEKLEQRDT